MDYTPLYHPDVLKEDLPKIPSNMKETIRRAIEERLVPYPLLAGKPLCQSLKGHRKLRVGDYRVIYRIQGRSILILKIGHRREVYTTSFARIKWAGFR